MKIKTCRICLVMDVKMFNLGNTELSKFMDNIFNLYGYNQNLNALHYICYECKAYLEKTYKFIQRVLKAQQVLSDMLKEKKKICQTDLQSLDRNKLGLDSGLRKCECVIDLDCQPSNIITNYIDNCMHKSKEDDAEIKSENTGFMIALNNFIKIKKEIPDTLTSTLNSDNETALLNNEPLSELYTSSIGYRCIISKSADKTDMKCENNALTIANLNGIPKKPVVKIKKEITDSLTHTLNSDDKTAMTNNKPLSELYTSSIGHICTASKRRDSPDKNSHTQNSTVQTIDNEQSIKTEIRSSYRELDSGTEIKSNSDNGWCVEIKTEPLDLQSTSTNIFLESKMEHLESINEECRTKDNSLLLASRLKMREEDNNFQPLACSGDTEESNIIRLDGGRPLKKLVYPRKCDHCNFEVPLRKEHYIHYLRFHKDVLEEYPYTRVDRKHYVCKFCGKISKVYKNHKIHEFSHGERTVNCTMCSKKFTCSAKMKAHLRCVHSGKTYECDYCGKVSKTRSDFILHTRIHTGEKPYKCEICGVGFAHGGNKTAHIRTVHQNTIFNKKKKLKHKNKRQSLHNIKDAPVY